jgi:hypothetical protein
MAEDNKQTLGTVLDRLGGMGSFYQPNQQAIADAVRSGSLSRADVNTLTSAQMRTLGQKGYRELYPEVFSGTGGFGRPQLMSPEEIEIAALRELRAGLTGVGNYYYRKLIDARITALQVRMGGRDREVQFDIPDWMKPLISEGIPYQSEEAVLPKPTRAIGYGKGRRPVTKEAFPEGAGKLASLGAQTELSVDQMKFLQGYLGWGKGGFATGAGKQTPQAIQKMAANQQAAWEEYIRRSQSMFPPSVRLGVQKRIASQ